MNKRCCLIDVAVAVVAVVVLYGLLPYGSPFVDYLCIYR
jgi:hypothetical protein